MSEKEVKAKIREKLGLIEVELSECRKILKGWGSA